MTATESTATSAAAAATSSPEAAAPEAPDAASASTEAPAGVEAPSGSVATAADAVAEPPAVGTVDAGTAEAARQRGGEERIHIYMAASEAHPFAKTGGLAEVAGALPAALARLGHQVTLFVPKYRGVQVDGGVRGGGERATIQLGTRRQEVTFLRQPLAEGVTAVLVDAPELFDRETLYGTAEGDYPDNAWRFAVFSRAVLEYARMRGERPSIIHAHDWQTGLLPAYQKMHLSADPAVGGVPVVFTIHDLAFQGIFPPSVLRDVGFGWDVFDIQGMEYWGQISTLKAGINFSERITTVSPNYAKEITRPEMGFGFEGVLARRSADLVGIVNGIDTERWNPADDLFVEAPYSADDLAGKRRAKALLLEEVGLPAHDDMMTRPLIGLVSRLTDQQGLDLIEAAAADLLALDAGWVMLGSGERRYEELWTGLAAAHPDRVAATIGFSERLAHLIEAGADAFLMPSRFEPCGLNQLYSLRYGTIPIVRAVGGLDDTVEDYDQATGRGTGVKFRDYTPSALVSAVRRALELYRNPKSWQDMQRAGMEQDHSWDASAREYVKVYRGVMRTPHGI
jgi:starch synthase